MQKIIKSSKMAHFGFKSQIKCCKGDYLSSMQEHGSNSNGTNFIPNAENHEVIKDGTLWI
jgi:hypothetical protein